MLDVAQLDLEPRVAGILNRHPAVGLAVGVVRDGALASFSAHGLADIATGRPMDADTVVRVASITKTFTAVALLQLWEQGLVDLDAPADRYLRAYRLIPADPGWPPATLRHLLTHTAGIGEEVIRSRALRRDFGESVPEGRPVPTPAEYYGRGIRIIAEPGTRFRYTDHGPTTVGQIVEDVSGLPFDRYLRERVFAPLGMADTDIVLTDEMAARLATGYTLGRRGPRAVTPRNWVTAGASNAYSTPRDMGRYLAALLGGRRQRARLGARARDAGHDVRPAVPARRPDPGPGTGLLPRLPPVGTPSSSTRACCPASTRRSPCPRATAWG